MIARCHGTCASCLHVIATLIARQLETVAAEKRAAVIEMAKEMVR